MEQKLSRVKEWMRILHLPILWNIEVLDKNTIKNIQDWEMKIVINTPTWDHVLIYNVHDKIFYQEYRDEEKIQEDLQAKSEEEKKRSTMKLTEKAKAEKRMANPLTDWVFRIRYDVTYSESFTPLYNHQLIKSL